VARDFAEIQTVYQPIEQSIDHFENGDAISSTYRFQVRFLVETKYRASIKSRLADLDGNASPTLSVGKKVRTAWATRRSLTSSW
jgi:hypothetical protein